jgi:hypothetical protein
LTHPSRSAWDNLLKQLAQREQRLHAAGEIHRFHRDVAEALFRIQVSSFNIFKAFYFH